MTVTNAIAIDQDNGRFSRGGVRATDKELVRVMRQLAASGRGTNRDLVDAARSKSSPIHSRFEWDDGAAAEKYRLEQARGYWHSYQVVWTNGTDQGTTKMFHVVRGEDGQRSRRSIEYVLKSQSAKEQVLDAMLADLQAFTRRHAVMRRLASARPLFRAIDTFLKKTNR